MMGEPPPMADVITSRKNDTVKEFLRLSGSPQRRREEGAFTAEGARLCADAAASGLKIRRLLVTAEADAKYAKYLEVIRRSSPEESRVAPSVANTLSGTKNPQGVFCVCSMPEETPDVPALPVESRLLILEDLQDPANLGAVLRTAEALGLSGAVLCGDCCDPFSPKSLRAGMGAAFRLPLHSRRDAAEAVRRLNRAGCRTFAAVPSSSAVPVTQADFSAPCAVVIGNEGNGLTAETESACAMRITIPMLGRAESLNAASSAAILMWEMMRQKAGGGRFK